MILNNWTKKKMRKQFFFLVIKIVIIDRKKLKEKLDKIIFTKFDSKN